MVPVAVPQPRHGRWFLAAVLIVLLVIGLVGIITQHKALQHPSAQAWAQHFCTGFDVTKFQQLTQAGNTNLGSSAHYTAAQVKAQQQVWASIASVARSLHHTVTGYGIPQITGGAAMISTLDQSLTTTEKFVDLISSDYARVSTASQQSIDAGMKNLNQAVLGAAFGLTPPVKPSASAVQAAKSIDAVLSGVPSCQALMKFAKTGPVESLLSSSSS